MSNDRESDFLAIIRANPINAEILDRLPSLGLPDAWLVSGCLFQSVWNHLSGRPLTQGIKDYDIFYFDDGDLSWAAEDAVIQRCAAALADLDAEIEVRNQARVHLWYEDKFGLPYPSLRSSCEGIDRFLEHTSKIGVQPDGDGGLRLYAPMGLSRVWAMEIEADRNTPHFSEARYAEKVSRWISEWPGVRCRG